MATVAPETTEAAQPGILAEDRAATGKSPRELFWARFKQDRAAFVGLAIILFLVAVALAAPLISRLFGHGPNELFQQEMTDSFGLPKGPNGDFLFGADTAGRDLLVRVAYGARTSLLVAIVATGLAVFAGTILGIVAGYFGGKVDTFISRSIDVILSVPILLFALGIVAACSADENGCLRGAVKPGLTLVIAVIALFSWPYVARIVRGNTLSLREKEFIEAARSLGAGNGRIMFREVLPNLVAPIIVYSTLLIPSNIIFEASLSFLGVGVPQSTPSWGRMLSDAASGDTFRYAPWLLLFPGIALIATTLAFNLLGDGLRDALDPRSNR